MEVVDMQDAQSSLARLVRAVESGAAREIIISRNGRPAARLVGLARSAGPRIGVARGQFLVPDDIDADQAEVSRLFIADHELP